MGETEAEEGHIRNRGKRKGRGATSNAATEAAACVLRVVVFPRKKK